MHAPAYEAEGRNKRMTVLLPSAKHRTPRRLDELRHRLHKCIHGNVQAFQHAIDESGEIWVPDARDRLHSGRGSYRQDVGT